MVNLYSYGTLLGTSIFNTFFQGIIAFRVLPRPMFGLLQTHLFPPYFTLQTILPLLALSSYPTSSFASLTSDHNLYAVTIPLASSAVLGALNWLWLGPWTTKVMKLRKHQETRDGKKSYDEGPQSAEMKRLNSTFSKLHGASSLVNLVDIILLVWYAFSFAGKTTVVA
jgi:hypothetical protein